VGEGDVALACMRVLVDELARAGMRAACIAPGSRSAPIALALERDERMRVFVHLDERAAAFFALGLAKATGDPVAVVCTSGTAATNFFPAIVEAARSGAALVALTADRPPELRGTGANQTIDQVGLYGGYPRLAIDADVPAPGSGATWRALGRDAARAALGPPPAPVHVNLPFREPLVPEGRPVDLGDGPATGDGWMLESLCRSDVDAIAARIGGIQRGVVLACGLRSDASPLIELAATAGWPLIAEPHSNLRRAGALGAGWWLLADGSFAEQHVPDLVLHAGALPTTRAAQALLAQARSVISIDECDRQPTPGVVLDRMIVADPGPLARAAAGRVPPAPESPWLRSWREADALARAAVDGVLDATEEVSELRAARDLAAAIRDGATLVASSSMPVRDLDATMAPREGVRVLANRGASGIDGVVSTVLGVAAAGAPTYALVGDLAMLHDASGLLWSSRLGVSATLVVPNNRGGGIFDLLAQSELPEHERLFVTPHDIDLEALARAARATYARVERAADLAPALDGRGVRIIELPIDRARAVALRREVTAAVREALS